VAEGRPGDGVGPFRAALAEARSRRAPVVLLAIAIGIVGLVAWGSYPGYRTRRALLEKAERGTLTPAEESFLVPGYSCDGSSCRFIDPATGEPFGPEIPVVGGAVGVEPGVGPGVEPGVEPGGGPGGVRPPPIPEPGSLARSGLLPRLLPAIRESLEREAARLAPRVTFAQRARTLGTFPGVLFGVLAAAALLGAEWRWGVWKTLLTHEPRRGVLLAARLATLWLLVAAGFAVALGAVAGLDAIFRAVARVGSSGGPGAGTLARTAAKGLLSVEVYATLAAALTMALRTSLAGVGSLVVLLVDGLVTERFRALRHALPAQQVAALLAPREGFPGPGYVWWPRTEAGAFTCQPAPGGGQVCFQTPLAPIPPTRAVLVLLAWVAALALGAWAALRARDAPV
jgi:hypothetical protein